MVESIEPEIKPLITNNTKKFNNGGLYEIICNIILDLFVFDILIVELFYVYIIIALIA